MSTPHERFTRIAQEAHATGDTGWFERAYAAALAGGDEVPWRRDVPNPRLVARVSGPRTGRALVVGCGYGHDAGYLAGLGYRVTAFDLSATAVEAARASYPDVEFRTASALDPPPEWAGAFDLVFEAYTIQVLRGPDRVRAARAIASCAAPGGTVLVVAFAARPDDPPARIAQCVTPEELTAFTDPGLTPVLHELQPPEDDVEPVRWHHVAEYLRFQVAARS